MDSLDDLRRTYDGWHVWRGISGLVYARKLKRSPPAVLRAAGPHAEAELGAKIEAWLAEHSPRPPGGGYWGRHPGSEVSKKSE